MHSTSRFLLFSLLALTVAIPTAIYAKEGRGVDDDVHFEDDNRDEERERHGRHRGGDNHDDARHFEARYNEYDTLEVEADVFTDTTIVKVELPNGRHEVFASDANTREEVIDAVVTRFNLTRAEVSAVLNYEEENRASRAQERAKITGESNRLISENVLRVQIARLEALLAVLRARLGD